MWYLVRLKEVHYSQKKQDVVLSVENVHHTPECMHSLIFLRLMRSGEEFLH